MPLKFGTGTIIDIGIELYDLNLDGYPDEGISTYSWLLGLLHYVWLPIHGWSAYDYFGFPGQHHSEPVTFKGFAPVNSAYDQQQDYHRYSFPLGEAIRLASASKGYDGSHANEHDVHHFTASGSLRPKGAGLFTFTNVSVFGADRPQAVQRHGAGNLYWYGLANSSYPTSFGTTMSLQDYAHPMLHSLPQFVAWARKALSVAKENGYTVQSTGPSGPKAFGGGGGSIYSYISEIDLNQTDMGFTLDVTEFYVNTLSGVLYRMPQTIVFNVRRNSIPSVFNPIGNWDRFDATFTFNRKIERYYFDALGSSDIPFHSRYVDDGDNVTSFTKQLPGVWAFPLTKVFTVSPDFGNEILGTGPGGSLTLRGFYEEARVAARWMRPSVNTVLGDIVSDLRAVASNWIEFLNEADELLELFPKDQLLSAIWASDADYAAIPNRLRAIARACAGGYLLYSFGWRPLFGAPQDAESTLYAVADRYEGLLQSTVFRKAKTFTLNADDSLPDGIMPNRLTTRSKVTVGGFTSQFSSDILLADSVGFLPTSSRLWDLVPGSWLFDYFSKFGNRIDTVDSFVLMCLMDSRSFVHSYTLEFDIVDEYLNQFELETANEAVVFKLYVREASAYVPFLFDVPTSDMFITTGRPQWGIILALMVSLIL